MTVLLVGFSDCIVPSFLPFFDPPTLEIPLARTPRFRGTGCFVFWLVWHRRLILSAYTGRTSLLRLVSLYRFFSGVLLFYPTGVLTSFAPHVYASFSSFNVTPVLVCAFFFDIRGVPLFSVVPPTPPPGSDCFCSSLAIRIFLLPSPRACQWCLRAATARSFVGFVLLPPSIVSAYFFPSFVPYRGPLFFSGFAPSGISYKSRVVQFSLCSWPRSHLFLNSIHVRFLCLPSVRSVIVHLPLLLPPFFVVFFCLFHTAVRSFQGFFIGLRCSSFTVSGLWLFLVDFCVFLLVFIPFAYPFFITSFPRCRMVSPPFCAHLFDLNFLVHQFSRFPHLFVSFLGWLPLFTVYVYLRGVPSFF